MPMFGFLLLLSLVLDPSSFVRLLLYSYAALFVPYVPVRAKPRP